MTVSKTMNLKSLNRASAACFLLSSASLLFVPLLNSDSALTKSAVTLASVFWSGLLIGLAVQMYLWLKTRRGIAARLFTKAKLITAVVLAAAVVVEMLILLFFQTNAYALPCTLCVIIVSVEAFCVLKREEKLP